jgi:sugar O-acyltransferase (sialic acid O-acetyltransferase NeuD family)
MDDQKPIVIVGAGETAELAWEYFTRDSDRDVEAFAVEARFLAADRFCGLPVVPVEDVVRLYPPETHDAFVAVSYAQVNRPRARLFGMMIDLGYELASYVSSRAFIWPTAQLGRNCFVLENNVLQHGVVLGDDVYLWSGNHVGHRSRIEDHTYVSSHVVISGFCSVGTHCFLGVNACVADFMTIADDCVIGAGAVVVRSTEPDLIYLGNPARSTGRSSRERFAVADE